MAVPEPRRATGNVPLARSADAGRYVRKERCRDGKHQLGAAAEAKPPPASPCLLSFKREPADNCE